MNIFNSLGSNYSKSFVKKALFAKNNVAHIDKLIGFLGQTYDGEVHVTHKGRDALTLALQAAHIPPQAKVVINGFTCIAVHNAVVKAGCIPVVLDIDPATLHFEPETLKKVLEKDEAIKAVIVQNTLSYPCNISTLNDVCKKYNCILIEDGAHCVGTNYDNGKPVGTVGDLVALSFSQDKIIDGISGGALIIRNKSFQRFSPGSATTRSQILELKDRLYPLLTTLIRRTYPYFVGRLLHFFLKILNVLPKPVAVGDKNYALSPFCAQLILHAYERSASNISHRQHIAQIYHQYIDPSVQSGFIGKHILTSANLRFPIFVQNRGKLISHLAARGVYIGDIWYDAPIAPASNIQYDIVGENGEIIEKSASNAQKIADTIINLPTHEHVTSAHAMEISEIINQWLKQNK